MNKGFICETSPKCMYVILSYAVNKFHNSVPMHLYNRQKQKRIPKIGFVLLFFYISDYSVPKKNGIGGTCGAGGACKCLAGKLEGKKSLVFQA